MRGVKAQGASGLRKPSVSGRSYEYLSERAENMMKRCGIFLFFDKDGVVDSYVLHLLYSLKPHMDHLLAVCNGYVNREGLKALRETADDVLCRVNLGMDVGGYREGLFYLGWERLSEFDEVALFNYTFFGPIYPFSEMFEEMERRDVDFWGITKHHRVDPDPFGVNRYGYLPEHIQSHFMVLRKSLFMSYPYKDFIFNTPNPKTYLESICEYETVFTKHFEDLGFRWDVYVDTDQYEGYSYCPIMFYTKEMMREKRCPIIKRRSFFTDYSDFLLNSCGEPAVDAYEYIRDCTKYDTEYIWENILRLENLRDIHRVMHFNYMLPAYGTPYEGARGDAALFLLAERTEHVSWCARYLRGIPEYLDVFVVGSDSCRAAVREYLPEAVSVREIEREDFSDYLGVLAELSDEAQAYRYAGILDLADLKQLTRPPYSNGASWQYADFENLLGNEQTIGNLLLHFEQEKRLGAVIPPMPEYGEMFAMAGADGWYGSYDAVLSLLRAWGARVTVKKSSEALAPVGGSFWVRTELLNAVKDAWEKTGRETAADRLTVLLALPLLFQYRGFYTGAAFSERYAPVAITNQDYMLRETNKTVFAKYGPTYHNVVVGRIRAGEVLEESEAEKWSRELAE